MASNKQVDIILWMKCNEKCNFCFQDTDYIQQYDKKFSKTNVLKILIQWRKNGYNMVNISWGEPTIYEFDFYYTLKIAKQLQFKTIKVITNGIQFSKIDFCNKNLPYITDIWFSFHAGSDKIIQDKLTWLTGSYDLVLKALENINKFWWINLHNHCVITSQNIDLLEDHLKVIIKLWFTSIHFMSLMHNTDDNKKLSYDFDYLAIVLKDIIDKYSDHIVIEISYIQPCYFKWYESYILWFDYWQEYLSNNIASLKSWENTIIWNKIKKNKCKTCKFLTECHGFWKK